MNPFILRYLQIVSPLSHVRANLYQSLSVAMEETQRE